LLGKDFIKILAGMAASTIKGVAFESSSKPGYFYGLSKEYRGLGMIAWDVYSGYR